jgi:hypothetical protein
MSEEEWKDAFPVLAPAKKSTLNSSQKRYGQNRDQHQEQQQDDLDC